MNQKELRLERMLPSDLPPLESLVDANRLFLKLGCFFDASDASVAFGFAGSVVD